MSDTREVLEKAIFFLELARHSARQERKHFERFVEAAIVFGRSVTFHLQKEFAQHPDFSSWYAGQQELLRNDDLCRFFVERRNFILKEGPLRDSPVGYRLTQAWGRIDERVLRDGGASRVAHPECGVKSPKKISGRGPLHTDTPSRLPRPRGWGPRRAGL